MTVRARLETHHPTFEDVRKLCEYEGVCASIVLGPHKAGSGTRPSSVKLNAMLAAMARFLDEHGMARVDREDLLAPLYELCQDEDLDAGHSHGWALFRAPGVWSVFRLAEPLPDSWNLGRWFQVRPLLTYLRSARDCCVLALTRKRARMWQWSAGQVKELVFPPGVVTDFEEFLALEEPEQPVMTQSPAGPGVGALGSVVFGKGTAREREGRRFHDFCAALDRGVCQLLVGQRMPVVVMGTAVEVASYRDGSNYPCLVEPGLFASPDDGTTPVAAVAKAREILRDWLDPSARRLAYQYVRHENAGRSLVETHAILGAASRGRVAQLFVARDGREEGPVPRGIGPEVLSGNLQLEAEDLANAAAVLTLRHGGLVQVMPEGRMPAGTNLAAVLRY
jgi:hypothetical protein